MKTGRSAPQAPCRPVVRRLLRPPVPGRLSAGAGWGVKTKCDKPEESNKPVNTV